MSARFAALPRAVPSSHRREEILAYSVLAPSDRWEPAPVASQSSWPGAWARAWAAAAVLCLGTVLGLSSRSSAPAAPTPPTRALTSSACVVDDPSVSLFHGLESFDRLEQAQLVAAGPAGARSPR